MSSDNSIGIDFSITSPGICLNYKTHFTLHYLTSKAKFEGNLVPYATGSTYPTWSTPEERFSKIADWAMSIISTLPNTTPVFIEGYAFAGSGQVFQIAEATSTLKQRLYHAGYKVTVIPPTVAKKIATGSGRADKDIMYAAFLKETGLALNNEFKTKSDKVGSPVSDMVDAYWMSKCATVSTSL